MEHQAKRQKTRQSGKGGQSAPDLPSESDLDLPSKRDLSEKDPLDQLDTDITDVNSQ